MTRLGALRMVLALVAFAAMPTAGLASTALLPPLPIINPPPPPPDDPQPAPSNPTPTPTPPPPDPQPQPQPTPQPDPQPQPGPEPATTAAQPQPAPATPSPAGLQPFAYSGPTGRTRLGGTWGYLGDPGDRGMALGWYRGNFLGRHVGAPYVPNAWPVTANSGLINFRGSVGWFVKHFRVDHTGRYAIRFESVHHRARVWVDGKLVATHIGAYMSFEAQPWLKADDKHTLVVRADWRDPLQMKREGWHRGWFNFGGLNREVTIRSLGTTEIINPTITTRLRDDGAAIVSVTAKVLNHGPERTVRPYGELRYGGEVYPWNFRTVRIGKNAMTRVRRKILIQHPHLWSPGKPQLYDMQLSAGENAGWQTIVGLREIKVEGGRLFVNRKPIVLYGASIHEDVKGRGDGLLPSDDEAIVKRLQRIGANATRALHPLSQTLLERLDIAGILVWQQVGPFDSPGNWTARTPQTRHVASERVRQAVGESQTHPSILAWAVANEVAENGHEGGQARWVDRIARELKGRDPGRPVAIDVWGPHIPHTPGLMYSHVDLIGTTSYIGWYEYPFDSHGGKKTRIRRRVARLRRLFPNKAIFITEFGAEANTLNPRDRFGGFGYQAALIGLHLRTYERLPDIDGMLIWNLSDFALTPSFAGGSIVKRVGGVRVVRGINQKGLFDYTGHAKPAANEALSASAAVRAANARAAEGP